MLGGKGQTCTVGLRGHYSTTLYFLSYFPMKWRGGLELNRRPLWFPKALYTELPPHRWRQRALGSSPTLFLPAYTATGPQGWTCTTDLPRDALWRSWTL